MHSTEGYVCDSSMVNRKKRLSQNAKLASCCNLLLGRLPRPANAAHWDRYPHLSSSRDASKVHWGKRKTDLAGKTQVSKLCHSNSKVGDNFDIKYGHCQIKRRIISTTRLYVITYWDFGHGRALSQHFVGKKKHFSESLFLSVRPGWNIFSQEFHNRTNVCEVLERFQKKSTTGR